MNHTTQPTCQISFPKGGANGSMCCGTRSSLGLPAFSPTNGVRQARASSLPRLPKVRQTLVTFCHYDSTPTLVAVSTHGYAVSSGQSL